MTAKKLANYPNFSEQIIWLSGASTGIGEALSRQLAPRCKHLIISARSEEKLASIAGEFSNVSYFKSDINDLNSLKIIADYIQQEFSCLDTLIANAGTCEYVDVNNFNHQLFDRVVQTNFMGLIKTCEVALPLLKKSQRGYLVGMSSSVAYLPLTRAQAYGSSKAAISHFLEAMKIDLSAHHVDVSVISPGFVKTPLTDKNDFPMPMRISAEEAASIIVRALPRRPWEIHFPKKFTLILKIIASLPPWLRMRITQSMSVSEQ